MRNYIGCSGFNYDHWAGKFFPEDIPKKEWLEYYAEKFDSVEINASFYNLPKEKTLINWHNRVPGNFKFTLKGSRFVTHQKKLNDIKEPVKRFYDLAAILKGKLGCILWQIPGNQHKDVSKLKEFCRVLSADFHNVIEFRHNSWYDEEVYDVMEKHQVTFCVISAPDGLSDEVIKTTDRIYMRFHGKEKWYRYKYSENELKQWAKKLGEAKPSQIYTYFNNDYHGHAFENAAMFNEMIG